MSGIYHRPWALQAESEKNLEVAKKRYTLSGFVAPFGRPHHPIVNCVFRIFASRWSVSDCGSLDPRSQSLTLWLVMPSASATARWVNPAAVRARFICDAIVILDFPFWFGTWPATGWPAAG
jgi:hypothetical protein